MYEDMSLDEAVEQIVVGIDKDHVFARACLKAFLGGQALATIILPPHYFGVWKMFFDFLENVRTLVGRRIVNDDALYVWIGLCSDRVENFSQIAPIVVVDDDDADQGEASMMGTFAVPGGVAP